MNLIDRFLHYVSFDTTSSEESETLPSTGKQKLLGQALYEELKAMGLSDVRFSECGYVYATLPANTDKQVPTLGLIAHMDTSPAAEGANIRPRIVEYSGGSVLLNEERGIYLTDSEFPELKQHAGKHLIVTDGTTLLGADDKAGIAEIITAVEELMASGAEHGTVKLGFTPDEEVGRGPEGFDMDFFHADYGYTLDGDVLGGIEYENFNAAAGTVTVHGLSVHPGSAKDKMKNAALIAMEFNALLPADEIPAKTEGYEGFFHLTDMTGECENATLHYIIRDHDAEKFAHRKVQFITAADVLNRKYGLGTVEVRVKDSYRNMREMIEPHMYVIERAEAAMRAHGVEPFSKPIRGGTDGATFSFRGLPCPNLSTGGGNYHGRFEYAVVEDMQTMVKVCKTLITDLVRD
ncbi:MAG: peptidase T [Oscillospiraceae bacterium]|nr:peptidase T [Oscillospiraceae bacterium]